jgi:hypothetical protein
MEDYQINENTFNKDDEPTWDLDDAHIQHLKELGIWDGDDGDEFIDFKIKKLTITHPHI